MGNTTDDDIGHLRLALLFISLMAIFLLLALFCVLCYFLRCRHREDVDDSAVLQSPVKGQSWIPLSTHDDLSDATSVTDVDMEYYLQPNPRRSSVSKAPCPPTVVRAHEIPLGLSFHSQPTMRGRRASVPNMLLSTCSTIMDTQPTAPPEPRTQIAPGTSFCANMLRRLSDLSTARRVSLSTGCLDVLHETSDEAFAAPDDSLDVEAGQGVPATPRNSTMNALEVREMPLTNYNLAKNSYGAGVLRFSVGVHEEEKFLWVEVHQCHFLISHKSKPKGRFYVKMTLDKQGLETPISALCLSRSSLNLSCHSLDNQGSHPRSSLSARHPTGREVRTMPKFAYRTANFEEIFKFPITSAASLADHVLTFVVKEIGKLMEKNMLVGLVKFPLVELLLSSPICMESRDLRMDIVPLQEVEDKGEILVSLSVDIELGKLYAGIIQARGLRVPEKIHSCTILISVMGGEHVLASKEFASQLEKLLHESLERNLLVFDLPRYGQSSSLELDNVSVLLTLEGNKWTTTEHTHTEKNSRFPLSSSSRRLRRKSGASGAGHKVLGRCVLGPASVCHVHEAVEHFQEVVNNPGRVVLQWQKMF